MDGLPSSCDGCGACCGPALIAEASENDEPLYRLRGLITVRGQNGFLVFTRACEHYDPLAKRCRHYHERPQACRRFSIRSDRCLACRRWERILVSP